MHRIAVLGLIAAFSPAFAADWKQFRGPGGQGISDGATGRMVLRE